MLNKHIFFFIHTLFQIYVNDIRVEKSHANMNKNLIVPMIQFSNELTLFTLLPA